MAASKFGTDSLPLECLLNYPNGLVSHWNGFTLAVEVPFGGEVGLWGWVLTFSGVRILAREGYEENLTLLELF